MRAQPAFWPPALQRGEANQPLTTLPGRTPTPTHTPTQHTPQDQQQQDQGGGGVLKLTGFVRGVALSANQLVTIPGVSGARRCRVPPGQAALPGLPALPGQAAQHPSRCAPAAAAAAVPSSRPQQPPASAACPLPAATCTSAHAPPPPPATLTHTAHLRPQVGDLQILRIEGPPDPWQPERAGRGDAEMQDAGPVLLALPSAERDEVGLGAGGWGLGAGGWGLGPCCRWWLRALAAPRVRPPGGRDLRAAVHTGVFTNFPPIQWCEIKWHIP
jgi:hypothetical protein